MKQVLFHGSEHIVREPSLSLARPHNDYGPGLYCTLDVEMAKEWACKRNKDGFANQYTFDLTDLRVLDLMDGNYNVLHWITLLLANRSFDLKGDIAPMVKDWLQDHYLVDLSSYDVVVGYRADDSYFQYAQDFVEGTLSLQNLSEALALGKLGEQTVLVSEKAFGRLSFERDVSASRETYYPLFISRDTQARRTYGSVVAKRGIDPASLFALDLVRQEVPHDDPRIPRMLR